MLSLHRKEIIGLFEENGFTIPCSRDWGAQERYCMHLLIPKVIPSDTLDNDLHIVREEHNRRNSSLKLLTKTGEEIGVCRVHPAECQGKIMPGCVVISWLWIKENWRNRSLGKYLLSNQLEWAKKNGAEESILTTHTGQPAHYLYRKLGYEIVDTMRTYCLP